MKRYTFVIEPGGKERTVIETSEKLAYKMLWQRLSTDEQDNVACMECVDEQPATQKEYNQQFKVGI